MVKKPIHLSNVFSLWQRYYKQYLFRRSLKYFLSFAKFFIHDQETPFYKISLVVLREHIPYFACFRLLFKVRYISYSPGNINICFTQKIIYSPRPLYTYMFSWLISRINVGGTVVHLKDIIYLNDKSFKPIILKAIH